MSMIGLLGLLVAFAGCVISVLCLGVAHILYKKRSFERSETFAWGGRVAAVLVAAALTVCCAVLVWSLGGAPGLASVLGMAHCRVQRGARVRHAQECAPAR